MERLETEHGIFESNDVIGLSAKEVYDKWLDSKDNPVEPELTEIDLLMLAVAELDIQRGMDKTETQMAIAELASTMLGGM